jgi:hypothetical protein
VGRVHDIHGQAGVRRRRPQDGSTVRGDDHCARDTAQHLDRVRVSP